MLAHIVRRIGLLIFLLFAVTALSFAAMNTLGDPLFNLVGPAAYSDIPADIEAVAEVRTEYHFDEPLPIRYGYWVADTVRGDFGVSFSNDRQPVSEIVRAKLPKSLLLMVMAQTMAMAIAIPWGVLSAARANSTADRISTFGSFLAVALPNFALGIILFFVFSVKLGWFPTRFDDANIGSRLYSLFLPAATLALPTAAVYQRLLRTELITTLQQDFITMALSKGVPRRTVLFRHALRPSMFSFITVFGINAGALIGGSLVVERIFTIPGIGAAIPEAVIREDFPVVLALVVIIATVFVLVNFVVDALYSVLDPRVRKQGA